MNKHSLKLALIALGTLASAAALAEDKTDGQWRGSGGAALSMTSGNSTTTNVVLNADAARVTTEDKLAFGAVINYAKSSNNGVDTTTADRWNLNGEYDVNLAPQTFVFGKAGLSADKVIDLNLRSSIATGLGYKVFNSKELSFDVYGGLGYTTDRYSVDQTIEDRVSTTFSRVSAYLGESSSQQLTSTVSVKQRLDLYPGVSGDKALLANFNAGLSVAMSSKLNLTVGFTDTYNDRPPAGTKSSDLGLFTGINMKFGAN